MGIERVSLAIAAAAAVGAVACAGILGIEDRSLDPEASDGGTTGDDGGSCGDPCTMLTGLNHPFAMTADETNVYWVEYGDQQYADNGSVKSCPVSGCGSGPLVYAVTQTNPTGIAVDAQNVYWSTQTDQSNNGAIWSCPLAGCNGAPKKVVDANAPEGIALDDTYVYWADNFDDTVLRAPKSGGAQGVLWDGGSGNGVAMSNGESVAVDSQYVYVTDHNYSLYRLPVGGGNLVQMFAQNAGWVGGPPVTVDTSAVYFAWPGQIVRLAKTSTNGGAAIATNVANANGLVVDSPTQTLYYSDWGSGTGTDGVVGKVPLDGGASVALHSQLVTPEAVALNSQYLFWLSNGTIPPGNQTGAALPGTGALYRGKK